MQRKACTEAEIQSAESQKKKKKGKGKHCQKQLMKTTLPIREQWLELPHSSPRGQRRTEDRRTSSKLWKERTLNPNFHTHEDIPQEWRQTFSDEEKLKGLLKEVLQTEKLYQRETWNFTHKRRAAEMPGIWVCMFQVAYFHMPSTQAFPILPGIVPCFSKVSKCIMIILIFTYSGSQCPVYMRQEIGSKTLET